jgi:hypothetical protein
MSKLIAYAFTALLAALPSLAIAQTTPQSPSAAPSAQGAQAEGRDLTEIRIDVVRNALQLSPDQAKYWPAIEEAIRARAEMRRQRVETVVARMDTPQPDRNFVQVLQEHATDLTERGASLRRLADAWQPLYPTLNDSQKRRMRVLAVLVVHGVREGLEDRGDRMETEGIGSAAIGAGTGESGLGR